MTISFWAIPAAITFALVVRSALIMRHDIRTARLSDYSLFWGVALVGMNLFILAAIVTWVWLVWFWLHRGGFV